MSMGFMVAAASRKRDDRGRYMEGPDQRMDGGYDRPMGNYSRMDDGPEMRRRRDSRGRYMEDDGGARMEYDGNQGNYGRMDQGGASSHYWPGPHMPPYGDGSEMRQSRDSRGRYMEGGASAHYMPWPEPHIPPYLEQPDMRSERQIEPDKGRMHKAPERQSPYGGEPEVYKRQREEAEHPSMAGGRVRYKKADGGSGNIAFFQDHHQPESLNLHDEHPNMRRIGFQHHDGQDEELDKQTAMKWVEDMVDDDGVRGGKYSWHQAQQYAMNKGITGEKRMVEFYAAMNAMYSDFHEAGKKFGVDKPEFYACLAKLFIEDRDAVDDKLAKYYKYIVRHEDE